jgi:tetratricopeptide (TPR) repeat protein
MYRLLAAGLLLASSLFAQVPSPEELLRRAAELQQAGDLDGAVTSYREFLGLQPNEAPVHSNLGVLLSHLGRYDEAVVEYQKALDLDPQNASIVRNLGLAYYKSGRIPDAANAFSKAKTLAPDNLQTMLLLADCDLRMGDNRAVIALLTPAEQQNADNAAIAYMLGIAMIRDEQVEEGQKRVDRILRNGESAEARFLLGSQMFASGDFPAAVKQFAGAIDLNPALPDLEAFYGRALLNTGDPDAAAEAFRKELASDPNHFEANLYLSQILGERQQWSDADPLARRAVLVRPDSLEAQLEVADIDVAEEKLKEAKLALEAAEKTWPRSATVHARIAHVDEKLHLTQDAKREENLARTLQPRKDAAGPGPKTGDSAPAFTATRMGSADQVTLAELRKSNPVLLVFGSYTCPNFRSASEALGKLYPEYKDKIPFYLIYIREAHSTTDWASTKNQREDVRLRPATNMEEQQDHATMCVRKLRIDFPTFVDGMNGAAEKAYAAWPSKAFLLDKRGRIVYASGLSEQDFKPEELENQLRKLTALGKEPPQPHRFH